jgi:DNA polymerase-4
VFDIFRRSGARVQPGSLEEAFLEINADLTRCRDLAVRLRREVREEAGLPLSVGVARTKVLAKMASRRAKPDGLMVVEPAREGDFLHPLAVEEIWGVGPATAGKLRAAGLSTVGEAAALPEHELIRIVGKAAGRYVHCVAHCREPPPVQRTRGRRSFGAQRALGRGPRPRAQLDEALGDLADRISRRMERKGRVGRTVVLRLRFGDYTRATRSCTLALATCDRAAVAAAARRLLDAAMPLVDRQGITLVGLTVTNLDAAGGGRQLTLAEDGGDWAIES